MSKSEKEIKKPGVKSITGRLAKTVTFKEDNDNNKPDSNPSVRGSPVSPLKPNTTTTTTSSSSSSGKRSDSGNLSGSGSGSGSGSSSPTFSPTSILKPTHRRSNSSGSATSQSHPSTYSTKSSATSRSVNVLPAGNICPSGKVIKTGMESKKPKTDVLGSGTGVYGHGSIMRGGSVKSSGDVNYKGSVDPEELKNAGNEKYRRGNFVEALSLYSKAISISPNNAAYHYNRSAALVGLKRYVEAVQECEDAIQLDPTYLKAHHRLGSILISLGQVENARSRLCFPGSQADQAELLKIQVIEKHLSKCTDARRIGDWRGVLREADAAIVAGADSSPQLFACKAEALFKLRKLDEAKLSLSNVPNFVTSFPSCGAAIFFGMLSEAYPLVVRAQIDMAFGRFDDAVVAVEKAGKIDPRNSEVSRLLNIIKSVARARARGNDLFKSDRFTEACSAYGDGLKIDSSNSVLYCNRAACWYKLGKWDQSLDDCNQALRIQPNYTKALLRRAAVNSKLERWDEAVRDYETLREGLPNDKDITESLFHAKVALKKSRGEEVYNMKFGGEVEIVSSPELFRAAISSSGASVVLFHVAADPQCKQISPLLDSLCSQYPSLNFLKVDTKESPAIANAENVCTVPTFKIYKEGRRVKEMVCPRPEVLEASVKHYSN